MKKLERQVEVINRLGLHARASAKLVKTAASFASSVEVHANGKMVDGKSIMGLMMLAAAQGSVIKLQICGADAEPAMEASVALFANRFDEDE